MLYQYKYREESGDYYVSGRLHAARAVSPPNTNSAPVLPIGSTNVSILPPLSLPLIPFLPSAHHRHYHSESFTSPPFRSTNDLSHATPCMTCMTVHRVPLIRPYLRYLPLIPFLFNISLRGPPLTPPSIERSTMTSPRLRCA